MAGGKKLHLTITGIQRPPREMAGNGGADGLEDMQPVVTVQEVEAEYFCRDEIHYLFYSEQPGGCPQPLRTRVKLKGKLLEVNRQGPMGSRMVFEAGKVYRTNYPTPFGELLLDIVTESVETQYTQEQPGSWPGLRVRYILENEGQAMGEYELEIAEKKH